MNKPYKVTYSVEGNSMSAYLPLKKVRKLTALLNRNAQERRHDR